MVIVRIKTVAGTWRIKEVDLAKSAQEFKSRIEKEKQVSIDKLLFNKNGASIQLKKSLKSNGLKHGSLIFAVLKPGVVVFGDVKLQIDKDNKVTEIIDESKGLLPGQKALSDIKNSWDLTSMIELENKHTFVISGEKVKVSNLVSISDEDEFFSNFDNKANGRIAILFGKYVDTKNEAKRKEREEKLKERDEKYQKTYGSTKQNFDLKQLEQVMSLEKGAKYNVEASFTYEPAQYVKGNKFFLGKDIYLDKARLIAKFLELEIVGVFFRRPSKKEEHTSALTANELLIAHEVLKIKGEYDNAKPFIIGKAISTGAECYTATDQFLKLSKNDVIIHNEKSDKEKPCMVQMKKPYRAFVAKKPVHEIDSDLLINNVGITSKKSSFVNSVKAPFPRFNRKTDPSVASLGGYKTKVKQIFKVKEADGEKFLYACLSNFDVLLFVSNQMKNEDFKEVCIWYQNYSKGKLSQQHFHRLRKILNM